MERGEQGIFWIHSKYGEITIEYCSSNNKEHAGFIARIVRMGLGFLTQTGAARGSV
jgi:hypothetical protein